MSYDDWGDAWLRWAVAIPADQNPLLDTTGEDAGVGQSGPVWFLAGTNGPGRAERTVTVPAGKALFFPILNFYWIAIPPLGDPEWTEEEEAARREDVAELVEGWTSLACEIDGRAVKDLDAYRCTTPPDGEFFVDLPEDDLFGIPDEDLPAGTYGPAVVDGYYVMLAPLSTGQHTIHFHSEAGGGFELDVTYHITVASGR